MRCRKNRLEKIAVKITGREKVSTEVCSYFTDVSSTNVFDTKL